MRMKEDMFVDLAKMNQDDVVDVKSNPDTMVYKIPGDLKLDPQDIEDMTKTKVVDDLLFKGQKPPKEYYIVKANLLRLARQLHDLRYKQQGLPEPRRLNFKANNMLSTSQYRNNLMKFNGDKMLALKQCVRDRVAPQYRQELESLSENVSTDDPQFKLHSKRVFVGILLNEMIYDYDIELESLEKVEERVILKEMFTQLRDNLATMISFDI